MGDFYDLVEHVFHHNMIFYVSKVVGADDRFERMRGRGLRVTVWLVAALDRYGRDVVVTPGGNIEGLSSLENQNDEVVSLVVCKLAPERRHGKSFVKRGFVSSATGTYMSVRKAYPSFDQVR